MREYTVDDIATIQKSGDFKRAESLYIEALNQNPDDWVTIFYYSTLCHQMARHGVAVSLLNRVLSILQKPENKKAKKETLYTIYSNLGVSYRAENHYKKARYFLEKAIELKGDDSDLYVNLGSIYVNEGSPEKGEAILKKGIEIDPSNVLAHWNLSLTLLEQGKWKEAWPEYAYGKVKNEKQAAPERLPRWPGRKEYNRENEIVLTYGEQGIGDEIMFLSMMPDLIKDAKQVIYECHPRLENLARRSFPDVIIHPTRKLKACYIPQEFESVRGLGDLGELYRNSPEDFPKIPYLIPDEDKTKMFREELEKLGPGPYYGIGWRGGYKKTRKDLRSLSLYDMLPILEGEGTFISLQYDIEADQEVEAFTKETGIKLHHWPSIVREEDYDVTASLVNALDLVISCNTSVVHLAGAIGKECLTLTPKKCAWRYGQEKMMPWYGTVECVRSKNEHWEGPVKKVCEIINTKRIAA